MLDIEGVVSDIISLSAPVLFRELEKKKIHMFFYSTNFSRRGGEYVMEYLVLLWEEGSKDAVMIRVEYNIDDDTRNYEVKTRRFEDLDTDLFAQNKSRRISEVYDNIYDEF